MEREVPCAPGLVGRERYCVGQGDAWDARVQQCEATHLRTEHVRVGVGDPGPYVVTYKVVAADRQRLQQPVRRFGERPRVITRGWAVRVALAG